MEADTQALLSVSIQFIAAHCFTRFGLADLNDVLTWRVATKVVIERHDAMHFGARQIQCGGDDRYRAVRDILQPVLHRMQHLQQWARLRLILG